MNNPLGVSPSKGIREPHEVKKKSFDLGGNRLLYKLIVRGDWNCTLSESDKIGGKPWKATKYRNLVLTTMDVFDLIDIQHSKYSRPTNQKLRK